MPLLASTAPTAESRLSDCHVGSWFVQFVVTGNQPKSKLNCALECKF